MKHAFHAVTCLACHYISPKNGITGFIELIQPLVSTIRKIPSAAILKSWSVLEHFRGKNCTQLYSLWFVESPKYHPNMGRQKKTVFSRCSRPVKKKCCAYIPISGKRLSKVPQVCGWSTTFNNLLSEMHIQVDISKWIYIYYII